MNCSDEKAHADCEIADIPEDPQSRNFAYIFNITRCGDQTVCPGPYGDENGCCDNHQGINEIRFQNPNLMPSASDGLSSYYAAATSTSAPAATSSSPPKSGNKRTSTATTAGIGVGVGLGACVLGLLLFWFFRRGAKQRGERRPEGMMTDTQGQQYYKGGLQGESDEVRLAGETHEMPIYNAPAYPGIQELPPGRKVQEM